MNYSYQGYNRGRVDILGSGSRQDGRPVSCTLRYESGRVLVPFVNRTRRA